MLEASLIDLVRVYTVHRTEEAVQSDSESEPTGSEQKITDARLMRPSDSSPLPFANGCGTNAGSIYTGALLAVLDQAEVC
jgi:hypothetical protein